MNLIVDIGNTRIKTCTFEKNVPGAVQILESEDQLNESIKKHKACIISSVRKLKSSYPANTIVLSHKTSLPIVNAYGSPQTLGMDRLAGVVGCNYLYPDANCLLIDCGTCITFDFIDSAATYQGGSISPGLEMKFKALNNFTDALPLVEHKNEVDLIGKTTEESIQSGVINGTVAEIDQMILSYQNKFDNLVVVLTGGDAQFFESKLKATIFAQPKIVLIGLNRILEYNVEEEA